MSSSSKPKSEKSQSENFELINYKVDQLQEGFSRLEKKFDSQQHVSVADFLDLKQSHIALEKDVEDNYVQKDSFKTARNVGITLLTAALVAVVTVVSNFVLNGGLRQ